MNETYYDIFITDKDLLLCIHLFTKQVCLHMLDAGLEIFYLRPPKPLFIARLIKTNRDI